MKSSTCQKELCGIHDVLHWVGILGVQVSSDDGKTVAYPVSYDSGKSIQEERIPLCVSEFFVGNEGGGDLHKLSVVLPKFVLAVHGLCAIVLY
jgi:hypothetical protein